jgi:protocatechuate 3,4-dioxygenase alpha subunit
MRLSGEGENVLTSPETVGQRIRVEGRVLDGDRRHIEDALVELWQADSAGRYHHPADDRTDVPLDPAFNGFGRCASDFKTGAYSFLTIKPGPVPHPGGGMQAPHLSLTIQARGMLNPTFTRMYFADEERANATDPVLQSVPHSRRATLIAELVESAESSVPTYRFDIRYQGDDETAFFDV